MLSDIGTAAFAAVRAAATLSARAGVEYTALAGAGIAAERSAVKITSRAAAKAALRADSKADAVAVAKTVALAGAGTAARAFAKTASCAALAAVCADAKAALCDALAVSINTEPEVAVRDNEYTIRAAVKATSFDADIAAARAAGNAGEHARGGSILFHGTAAFACAEPATRTGTGSGIMSNAGASMILRPVLGPFLTIDPLR